MICPSCGKPVSLGSLFCEHCGSPIQKNTSASQGLSGQSDNSFDAGSVVAEQENPKKKNKPFPFVKKKDAPIAQNDTASPFVPGGGKLLNLSESGSLLAAFVGIELLPYLLRSVVLLSRQNTMSNTLYVILGIAGWLAAGAVLFLSAKQITDKNRIPQILSFLGLLAIERQAEGFLLPKLNYTFAKETFIFGIISMVITLVTAILMLIPLKDIYSPEDRQKQGGNFIALIFVLLALNAETVLELVWLVTFLGDNTSFISTCAYRTAGAFIEAYFFSLAVKRLLKKKKGAVVASKPRKGSVIFAAVTGCIGLVLSIVGGIPDSVSDAAAKDIETYLAQGLLFLGTGDMVASERAYMQAGEHCTAWKELAEQGSYSVPEEYKTDNVLLYFSMLGEDADTLRNYLVTSYDESAIDMWAPLMLEKYKQKEQLTIEDTEHRKELVAICIADEVFTNGYPTMKQIEKKSEEIRTLISTEQENQYTKYMSLASVLADFETSEISFSEGIGKLLDNAEQYPNDLSTQYIAAILGSSNVWDNAGHFDRTSEAVLRFRSIWYKEYGEAASYEEKESIELSCANMLMNIRKQDKALQLLKSASESMPDSKDIKSLLANCYVELGDGENSYKLAKEMYESDPQDVTTLWLYSVGALKKGENEEAIKIAGELADAVRRDESEPELDGDVLLFTCVTYFALNDSQSYTDYQYRIYNGDETDPELLKKFQENDFFYNYVNAVYWEKQRSDPEKALPYAEKALKEQENSGRLWYLNGMIYFDSKNYEKARDAYIQADKLIPNDPSTMFALANTYDALKEYQKAYDLCKQIQSLYPNGTEHLVDLYGVSGHVGGLMNSLRGYVKED